ncbi:hypothetical protein Pmani_004283 [Petrolisthes manimaculis]|uniref:Uncharacterized protein n=1 Tax=Petrolisthes manimaculis TaxID=1843537 RepID=A0AAE1UP54_9EUCA|nr:hypothetical protein Pmani_004283 [Petrolisthes manimaculis]
MVDRGNSQAKSNQDTPRRASSSSSVSRDNSRPRRKDDQLKQDSKRSNVGSDGSSSKRFCVNHLAVSQPAVNNVRLRSQTTVKLVRLRIYLLRNISLISSLTY